MALKIQLLSGLVLTFLLALLALALAHMLPARPAAPMPQSLQTKSVTIDNAQVQAEVADTDATREQGLSDRTSLPVGKGMLFVFQAPGSWGFWMKDMQFPIDIIFADASQKIVSIYANLSPSSYNAQSPAASVVYYPAKPAQYVLEVPAGFSQEHDVQVGDTMQF